MAEENKVEKSESPETDGAARAGEAKAEPPPAPAPGGGMPDWLRFPLVLAVVCALSALGLAGVYALTKKDIEESERRKVTGAFGSILEEGYSEEETEEAKVDPKGPLVARYVVRDAAGDVTAHAGVVKCPDSYNASEPIQLVVVLDPKLERVLGIRVAASKETPGLGERIKDPPSAMSIVGWIASRPARKRVVMKDKGGALVGTVETKDDGSVVFTDSEGERHEFKKDEVIVTQAPFPSAFLDQFTGIPVAAAKLASDGGAVDAITGATISSRAVVAGVGLAVEELSAAALEMKRAP